jgi:hypothetical protein
VNEELQVSRLPSIVSVLVTNYHKSRHKLLGTLFPIERSDVSSKSLKHVSYSRRAHTPPQLDRYPGKTHSVSGGVHAQLFVSGSC